jgi:1-acyl-sn-glycerol-3-phosphate acyltransferase
MRRLADRLVRLIARAATLGWFRAVEVTGIERIPRTGPVLLVAEGDGAGTRRNLDAFAACFAHLREGGAIGIFPEGEASDEAHLLPIRTGAARIALGAHSRGAMGLQIVPVGLIYEDRRLAEASGLLEDLRACRARLVHAVRAATSAHDDRRGPDGAGSLELQP